MLPASLAAQRPTGERAMERKPGSAVARFDCR